MRGLKVIEKTRDDWLTRDNIGTNLESTISHWRQCVLDAEKRVNVCTETCIS
jgi:hypothetical protein